MEIFLNQTKNKYSETFSLLDLDNFQEILKKLSSIKGPLEAKIFAVNESISCHQLLKLKNHFEKNNICSLCIYSSNRNTILSGKSLKIDSIFIQEQEIKKKLLSINSKKKDDILHKGTVRSGDRISSNGNLCIVGEFVIPELLGGSDKLYFGKIIWQEFFVNRDWPIASALAMSGILILVLPIIVFQLMFAKYNFKNE